MTFAVQRGEVHALIGENGAGKSTLMKILAGVHRPDAGQMTVAGGPFAPHRPAAALRAGVAMIHQELNLAPHLSVEANLLLGQEQSWWGWLRAREQRRLARAALERMSQGGLPLGMPVNQLSIGLQQMVEIARALVSQARVIVFDEPTSSLTEQDSQRLFDVIRELRQQQLGIVYISHFLEEIAGVCDVYTVLRDGQVAGQGSLREVSLDEIVRLMVGRELTDLFPHIVHEPGEVLLEVDSLSGYRIPQEVSFSLRRGEIFGLAGLVGAGRSELLRSIFGLHPVRSGQIRIAKVGSLTGGPRQSIRNGIGLVSEDRKEEGLALPLSIADNLTLTQLSPYSRLGVLNLRQRDRQVRQWMQRMACRAAGPNQPIEELSGGNQQKIAIARLLHQDADLLLLDEPTRGIDVGTKSEIYRLIGELARRQKAIILVSSYLPELLNVCDRIGVMCRGRLREVRPAAKWTQEEVMQYATGREHGR